jgi:hypothetical protein
MHHNLKLIALCIVLSGTIASGQTVRPSSSTGPVVHPTGPVGPPQTLTSGMTTDGTQSLIHGMAVDTNYSPLPNALVRLRNLQSSLVEQVSNANEMGEFTFPAKPEIPYVVEIASPAGEVLAVGDVVVAQPGAVAAAIVAIPTRLVPLAGVLGNAVNTVVSAATSAGITAVQATATPQLSPEQ